MGCPSVAVGVELPSCAQQQWVGSTVLPLPSWAYSRRYRDSSLVVILVRSWRGRIYQVDDDLRRWLWGCVLRLWLFARRGGVFLCCFCSSLASCGYVAHELQ